MATLDCSVPLVEELNATQTLVGSRGQRVIVHPDNSSYLEASSELCRATSD